MRGLLFVATSLIACVARGGLGCAPKAAATGSSSGEAQAPMPARSGGDAAAAQRDPAAEAGSPACTERETQPCALIPEGCPTGVRTCLDGAWGACAFDNPKTAPSCTTQCAGGRLSGDSLFAPVNRFDALRIDWAPTDLVSVPAAYRTIDPLEKMRVQALGHMVQMLTAQRHASTPKIYCGSPYRSFGAQCQLFGQYVAQDKCAKANSYSAMPGHSEHQLGSVCDLVYADNALIKGGTPADAWIAQHAYEYGFVQSYPEGTSDLTGYETEPWHYRYLGRKAALLLYQMQQSSLRAISTHEFISTIACWPALRVDELGAEDAEDAALARDTLCAQSKGRKDPLVCPHP